MHTHTHTKQSAGAHTAPPAVPRDPAARSDDQDREDKGTERETTIKRTDQMPTLTGVCVCYVCVYVRVCVCQVMAQFQCAALPLTQIKSGYLCLTLTTSVVCNIAVHMCMCVFICHALGGLWQSVNAI